MSATCVESIRNIALCGHGSAGKTSLIDALLETTGAVPGHHSVDEGTSVSDFDPEEKLHHYSIESAITHCDYHEHHLNLLDTPGYADFVGQMVGAVRAVEAVAICINAHSGIQLNSRRAMDEAMRAGDARIIIVTKLDDDHANFDQLLTEFRELWGKAVIPWNIPLGTGSQLCGVASVIQPPEDLCNAPQIDVTSVRQALIEAAVEIDETAMLNYLEGQVPSTEELQRLIPKAVAAGRIVPVFFTSAKLHVGLQELLDGLIACVPHPGMISHSQSDEGNSSFADETAPLVAQVFKNRIDPFVQKLSYIRVYAGQLTKDQWLTTSEERKPFKLGPLLRVQGSQMEPVESAGPGDIVAVAKIEQLHPGTILGEPRVAPIPFPKPMVGLALCPKSHQDENRLSLALHKIIEEDPTIRLERDPQTGELVISGMSELHLQIIRERLARRDHIEVETHDPKIPFRETIQGFAEGGYRHKKQSGGRGQFGEVHLRMFPFPQGMQPEDFCTKERFPAMKHFHFDADHRMLWIDSVVGGSIPGNFMPAIEKGCKERMEKGVLAGYQIQDLCVEVHFGKHHPVDSSEAAFKIAGSQCFKEVFLKARPCLLEPIVRLEVTVPDEYVGEIYGDLSSRGGRVIDSDTLGGGLQVVIAEAPLRVVTHYSRSLGGLTSGRGTYALEFDHYEMLPSNMQHAIVLGAKHHDEEDPC